MHIIVSKEIESVCPNFVGAAVEAQVVNTPYNAALWDEIHTLEARFREELTTESLKELSGIATASAASMPTSSWATPSPWG